LDPWRTARAQPSFLAVRTARWYTTIGRLKPGVTLGQALDDLNAIQARLGEQYVECHSRRRVCCFQSIASGSA
jgi:hypothetical protein